MHNRGMAANAAAKRASKLVIGIMLLVFAALLILAGVSILSEADQYEEIQQNGAPDFNTLSIEQIEERPYVSGNVEVVLECFAESYTTNYGVRTSDESEELYYLVAAAPADADGFAVEADRKAHRRKAVERGARIVAERSGAHGRTVPAEGGGDAFAVQVRLGGGRGDGPRQPARVDSDVHGRPPSYAPKVRAVSARSSSKGIRRSRQRPGRSQNTNVMPSPLRFLSSSSVSTSDAGG